MGKHMGTPIRDDKILRVMRRAVRDLVLGMGGPVFVPVGEWEQRWRMSDLHSNDGRAWSVGVSAHDDECIRKISIETSLLNGYWSPSNFVALFLADSVPRNVQFPFTVTLREKRISLRLASGGAIDLQMFYIHETDWIASVVIDDRRIEIRARLVEPDDVVLARVHDLSLLPRCRWELSTFE
jgi:hypothetical protein